MARNTIRRRPGPTWRAPHISPAPPAERLWLPWRVSLNRFVNANILPQQYSRPSIFVKRHIVTATDSRLTTLEHAFQAFADPTRLRILGLLAAGEVCVCNIHECLGIPQPTASRHLAYLRRKGLVRTRKEG